MCQEVKHKHVQRDGLNLMLQWEDSCCFQSSRIPVGPNRVPSLSFYLKLKYFLPIHAFPLEESPKVVEGTSSHIRCRDKHVDLFY